MTKIVDMTNHRGPALPPVPPPAPARLTELNLDKLMAAIRGIPAAARGVLLTLIGIDEFQPLREARRNSRALFGMASGEFDAALLVLAQEGLVIIAEGQIKESIGLALNRGEI